MPLASSSRLALRYKPEATFATPVSASNCYGLRITGESLNYDLKTDTSNEIRSDRQITDLIPVDAEGNGGFSFEMSYAEYDSFIEAVLQGTWTVFGTNGVSAAVPTSATFAAGTLTAGGATTGANAFTNLVMGQWVKIAGSTISGQNIWAQVSTTVPPTSTVLTFQGTPFTGLTGNGGVAVTVSGARVVNGTTQRSFTLEKNFGDISQTVTYKGMVHNKLSLKLASGALLTGESEFLGQGASQQAGTLLNASVTASTANAVMNGVSNVANILEGGAALSGTYIKSLSLDISNNLRGQDAIGTLGNVGVASGTVEVTGSIELYFADGTLYQKFINNTSSSLSFRINDASLNGYVFTLPNVKYSGGKINAGGINQDVMVSLNFQALRDSVSGNTIVIDRAGTAVVAAA